MTQVLERPEPVVEEFDRAPYSHAEIQWVRSIRFFTVHLLPLLVIFTGISTTAVWLFAVTYFGRMFMITAGYHRYFAHKSYRLNRFWQFVLAYFCTTAAQKGPLWWSGHHRNHHKF